MLILFTDTDTDTTPEIAKEYGYNLISMPYSVGGKEIFPYEDFEVFDYQPFYAKLRKGIIPSTSGISPSKYMNYFEPHFQNGDDILYVHFSTQLSGTFNAMNIAVDELLEKYPDRKFYTIDTKAITICSLNIVREIGDLYKQGKTIDEIMDWAKEEVDKFAIYFYADDLKFFQRSGRVSNFKAIVGDFFGIKPIINIGSDGKMVSIGKGKGRIGALRKIISYVEELQEDIKDHRVIIGHTDALEIAEILAEMLREKFGQDLNIEFVIVNPTAGSHCGPDEIGDSFHAKHR